MIPALIEFLRRHKCQPTWIGATAFCSCLAAAADYSSHFQYIENNIKPVIQIDTSQSKTLPQRMQELNVPGLSVAISVDGEIVLAKGYGYADRAQQRKITPDTLFQAASISKPITAVRVLQLAEQGIINLDTDVNQYLSQWQVPYLPKNGTEKVTARRLLSHTAGITLRGGFSYFRFEDKPGIVEILEGKGQSARMQVSDVPGSLWSYSNGGYGILQLLLMEADKQAFETLMYQHVLVPLGMASSTFDIPLSEVMQARAASGYYPDGTQVSDKWREVPNMAAGGLWSTPSDILQYAMHMQKIYHGNISRWQSLLSKETVTAMLTPVLNNHGLGPALTEHTFYHNGSNQGFRSFMVAWREYDVAVVVMTNVYDSTILEEYLLAVARVFNLPGYEARVYNPSTNTEVEREEYAGTYDIPELGTLVMSVTEQGLLGTPDFYPGTYNLLPESKDVFFNVDTGTQFQFTFDNGKVSGFTTDRVKASKIK